VIWYSGEDLKLWLEVLAQVHNGSNVSAAVAVVGRRPDGNDILVLEVIFVAFIDQLMGACNELQAVDMVELGPG
jgi:hypothetical protein